jgi:cytochrome c
MRTVALIVILAAVPAAARADGDAVRGERVFDRCIACHSVDPAETGLPGPNLHGVIGRPAASLPDFDYSPAMRAKGAAGLAWTVEALDAYLTDPAAFVEHGRMAVNGLARAQDRADVIAYIRRAGETGR